MKYHSAINKNETMPFTATRMDLESDILSEVSETEKEKYQITPLSWGIEKENDTNELLYNTEADSQTQRTNLWLLGEKDGGK